MILPLAEWASENIRVWIPDSTNPKNVDLVDYALNHTAERVALDIHVGDTFENDRARLAMPEELVLKPGECVRVKVRETLSTPMDVFGQVCSRASLSSEGLFVANLKIDPNFVGNLWIAVSNGGRRPIKIPKDEPFACIWFAKLASSLPDAPQRMPTDPKGIVRRSLRARLGVVRPHIITGAATIVVTVLGAILTNWLGVT